jgi:hypothetical protein
MYEQTFTGKAYAVRVNIWTNSVNRWSSGDHYSGGGEYTEYYVSGEVCIYNQNTGRPIFACGLTDQGKSYSSRPSDAALKRYVETEKLLPGRQAAYADWLAERWIKYFEGFDQSKGMPRIILTELDPAELVQRGFVADANGQQTLPLYDAQGVSN